MIRGAQVRGTVDCLFCGDPCDYSDNGAYCVDCGVFAMQPDYEGRWKVYVPYWMVPRETTK